MMNQVSEEQKSALTKTLAIVGFIAAILFAVWLAVQVVSVIPSAFSSLASLADGVYNYGEDTELVVANEKTVVNVGEPMTISWSASEVVGVYSLTYQCTDGASLRLRQAGELTDVTCGEPIALGDATAVEIVLESEKQRFIDVPYTVTFTPEAGESVSKDSKITVVNASLPATGFGLSGEENETEAETTSEPEVATEPEPEVAGETTETEAVVETPNLGYNPEPTYIEEPIYAIPTSDPNGTIDLEVTYIGVGILTSNNTFVTAGTIATDQTGAFRFEVKNIGTKTASDWSYVAELPSGIEYESGAQAALKPNERAVITLGFDGLTQVGTESFGATITSEADVDASNNDFNWAVNVVE